MEGAGLWDDGGGDPEPVVFGADAQEVLGDGDVVPGGLAWESGVLGLAAVGGVGAGDHLGVDVGLGAVGVLDVLVLAIRGAHRCPLLFFIGHGLGIGRLGR